MSDVPEKEKKRRINTWNINKIYVKICKSNVIFEKNLNSK